MNLAVEFAVTDTYYHQHCYSQMRKLPGRILWRTRRINMARGSRGNLMQWLNSSPRYQPRGGLPGGWAIDFFIGAQTRAHDDIDVQILRRDQQAVRAILRGWDVQGAIPPLRDETWPFRAWEPGTLLDAEVHDVWCRPHKTAPWAMQLMVADSGYDQWLFRRDSRISRPLATIGHQTGEGIPYLAPEVQLLYKAKNPRLKDEADFARTLPHLDQESRQWLAQALATVHPNHAWITQLKRCE